MIAYKGFCPGLVCRGYQFKMGLNVTEKANCAENGFHCAEDPLDCLRYYGDINHSEYYIVNAGGDIDEDAIDSKISCTELTILKKLSKEEIAEESVLIADKLVTNIIINTQGEENNNYIRMIYTGFNNYQGFKIHEGDILLCKDFDLGSIGIDWNFFLKKIYVKEAVFLYKGKFCIKINESAITLEHILYSIGEIRFDIIGNRYDNPELLDIQE